MELQPHKYVLTEFKGKRTQLNDNIYIRQKINLYLYNSRLIRY